MIIAKTSAMATSFDNGETIALTLTTTTKNIIGS